tara:strand:+ start:8969 stop:9133 length:165 start_codon:yes stop_codon:yes gene_type:complete
MKLEHLKRTLSLCIEHHSDRGDSIKVKQLETKLNEVDSKRLEDVTDFNGLYLND